MPRPRNNRVKQSLTAKQHILYARNCFNIHLAGRAHGRQMPGIYINLLAELQIILNNRSVKLYKSGSLSAELLQNKPSPPNRPEANLL